MARPQGRAILFDLISAFAALGGGATDGGSINDGTKAKPYGEDAKTAHDQLDTVPKPAGRKEWGAHANQQTYRHQRKIKPIRPTLDEQAGGIGI